MRALVTIQPGTGHLQTVMPAIDALNRAGHDVAVCSSPSFRPEVEARGLQCFGVGLDWLVSEVQTPILTSDLPPGPERTAWTFSRIFAGVTARRMAPDVISLARTWRPDLIIRETTELGGCLAAEALGIPHASVVAGARSSYVYTRRREFMADSLGALRVELGLAPDPQADAPYRFLHMSFLPASFEGDDVDHPPTAHFLHQTFSDGADEVPFGWQGSADRPKVLVSLGTIVHRTPGIVEAIIDALGHEPVSLLVAVGRDQDRDRFGPQPPSVRIERYVPQTALLDVCDLLVTHGGYNSVKEALTLGVPMVVIPFTGDTPYGAQCCADLGVAVVVPPDNRTPDAIRQATRRVLGEPSYRARAKIVREEISSLPGPSHAATLLETLAAERRPLIANQRARRAR